MISSNTWTASIISDQTLKRPADHFQSHGETMTPFLVCLACYPRSNYFQASRKRTSNDRYMRHSFIRDFPISDVVGLEKT